MPRVIGLDPAKGFGWAFYDTDKPPSAIESGSLKLKGDSEVDKLYQMRHELVPLIRQYQPGFAAIESPFKFAPRFTKKPKCDLLTGIVEQQAGEETTINPATISHAGQIAGAATMACLCWNVRTLQVQPRTWQTIIPKAIHDRHDGQGAPKKRVSDFCDMLNIISTNIDSRDACIIAMWGAGEAQRFLQAERAA